MTQNKLTESVVIKLITCIYCNVKNLDTIVLSAHDVQYKCMYIAKYLY